MIKRKILFVDDEPRILDGLRRMLRSMRQEWEMSFAQSGQEALDILDREPFGVIVADIRMPGMTGAQLLMKVAERYPKMVRIVLSGQADEETVLEAVKQVHQYLSKPCDAETLKSKIARACALSDVLENDALKGVISQIGTLPSLPSLYQKIEQELQSPDASAKNAGDIVAQDIAMSAKMLQLVNSAFFGIRQHVSSPLQAVILLGLETVKNLVLSVQVFAQFDQPALKSLSLQELWSHSMTVGAYAKRLATNEDAGRQAIDYAFIGGLLHDVGKLVLAASLPEEYTSAHTLADTENIALHEAERSTFGTTHAEVGCYLMGLWGLPNPIVEALAFHHRPGTYMANGFDTLTAVHIANALLHERHHTKTLKAVSEIDRTYLAGLGLAEQLPIWRDICQEIVEEGDDQ